MDLLIGERERGNEILSPDLSPECQFMGPGQGWSHKVAAHISYLGDSKPVTCTITTASQSLR